MPLTLENTGVFLVSGPAAANMATSSSNRKLRVNRPFVLEGRRREVGDEVVVPTALAAELITANKAELAENEPSAIHLAAKAEAKASAAAAKAAAPAAA